MRIKPPKRRKRSNVPLRMALQLLVLVVAILIGLMLNDMRRNRLANKQAAEALLAIRSEIKQNQQVLATLPAPDTTHWKIQTLSATEAHILFENIRNQPQNNWVYSLPYWNTAIYQVEQPAISSIAEPVKISLQTCYSLQNQLAEQQQNIRYQWLIISENNATSQLPALFADWNAYLDTRAKLQAAQRTAIKTIDDLQIDI